MISVAQIRDFLVKGCSLVTILIYLLIAGLLVAAAVVGAVEAIQLLKIAAQTPTQETMTAALQSILLIIVIATLIDMVRSYVTFGRVLVRPILIAGITTMVRRLLVASPSFLDILGITIIILGLTVAMIYLGREDRTVTKFLSGDKDALENEAVKASDCLHLFNLQDVVNENDNPQSNIVLVNYKKNRPYGCCIDRGSKVTIVSTSGYTEPMSSWLGYHIAKLGGFNFVAKETETEKEILYLNAPAVKWVQGDIGECASPSGWMRVCGEKLGEGLSVLIDILNLNLNVNNYL